MKVTVLVHNLNRDERLAACLDSLLAQNHRPLEVVLLDAGSTDDSLQVIESRTAEFARRDIDLVFEKTTMAGVPTSRNRAAAMATGSLLLFLDNDAVLDGPGTVGIAVERFVANDRLGALSLRVMHDDSDQLDSLAWVFRRDREWSRTAFRTFTFAGTAVVFRADAYQSLGGFWEALEYSREEEELALGLMDAGWEIWYDSAAIARHFPGQRGADRTRRRRFLELRNGTLVLYRRMPLTIAIPLIAARVLSMLLRAPSWTDRRLLLAALPDAARAWRTGGLSRAPIGMTGLRAYVSGHSTASRPTMEVPA